MKQIDYKFTRTQDSEVNLVGKVKLRLLVALAFIVIASFFGQLVFASTLAVEGEKLAKIEQKIRQLEAENTTLKVQIAKESALSNLSKEANELGFKKPTQVVTP